MKNKKLMIVAVLVIVIMFVIVGCKEEIDQVGDHIPLTHRGNYTRINETCEESCLSDYGTEGICLDKCNEEYPYGFEEKCGERICCCKEYNHTVSTLIIREVVTDTP